MARAHGLVPAGGEMGPGGVASMRAGASCKCGASVNGLVPIDRGARGDTRNRSRTAP